MLRTAGFALGAARRLMGGSGACGVLIKPRGCLEKPCGGARSIADARRYGVVTSTDYVQALLDKGRARAAAENLPMHFRLADAEALPFANASFDTVLSTFGVMFTPDHHRAASEYLEIVVTKY